METLQSAVILSFIFICLNSLQVKAVPLSCNVSTVNTCTSFLYFVSHQDQTAEQVADLFSVTQSNVASTSNSNPIYLVNVTCSCNNDSNQFFAKAQYIVKDNDSWDSITSEFNSLIDADKEFPLYPSANVELKLLCGCLDDVGVMTYQVVSRDTLFALSGRFGADRNRTKDLNRIANESSIIAGQIIFLPIPYPEQLISHRYISPSDGKTPTPKSRTGLIVGVASGVVFLVAAMIIGGFYLRSKSMKQGEDTSKKADTYHSQDLEASKKHMETSSICCSWHWTFLQCFGMENVKTKHATAFQKDPKFFTLTGFNSDKPVIFTYSDILIATDNLHESRKIGQGSYGAVYLGNLMEKEVAIKQMKDTKSKEFLAELKILCRVHHTNLVELIGYSAGGEHLFLVYEFAENGALSDCLHDPFSKGCEPLSWTTRVQIALDAARGLEYIHEHTKPMYVHRDVKTSNILLDSDFRAKIADFGLVKLLEHSLENQTSTTKVVGTFGYLAPEYVRDGQISTKNDVYAFGVVLMELITGQPALSRSTNSSDGDWRSLITRMLSLIKDANCTSNVKTLVDKGLRQYPEDTVLQMALLSKACVEDNPHLRPNMGDIVFSLSQMLQYSLEWEVAEAGSIPYSSDRYECR